MSEKKINKDVGSALRDAIKSYSKNQSELAEMIGVTPRQLQNYSNGEFPKYKNKTLKRLDEILNTNFCKQLYEIEFREDDWDNVGDAEAQNEENSVNDLKAKAASRNVFISSHHKDQDLVNALIRSNEILSRQLEKNNIIEDNLREIKAIVGAVQQKSSDALSKTAALQDILFERIAPLLNTTVAELNAALRTKETVYQNPSSILNTQIG